jgi:hypothetical protein
MPFCKISFEFNIFKWLFENYLLATLNFTTSIYKSMVVFGVVLALFALAIVSIWIFPNSKVSNNEHDIKH